MIKKVLSFFVLFAIVFSYKNVHAGYCKERYPLHYAIQEGKDISPFLNTTTIEQEDDPGINSKTGSRPLHCAVIWNRKDAVQLLLDRGADITSKGRWGKTALHFAAKHNRIDMIEFLLSRGAPLKAEDAHQNKPLDVAIEWNHPEMVQLLLEKGASYKHIDKNYNKIRADQNGDKILALLSPQLFPNTQNSQTASPESEPQKESSVFLKNKMVCCSILAGICFEAFLIKQKYNQLKTNAATEKQKLTIATNDTENPKQKTIEPTIFNAIKESLSEQLYYLLYPVYYCIEKTDKS